MGDCRVDQNYSSSPSQEVKERGQKTLTWSAKSTSPVSAGNPVKKLETAKDWLIPAAVCRGWDIVDLYLITKHL